MDMRNMNNYNNMHHLIKKKNPNVKRPVKRRQSFCSRENSQCEDCDVHGQSLFIRPGCVACLLVTFNARNFPSRIKDFFLDPSFFRILGIYFFVLVLKQHF